LIDFTRYFIRLFYVVAASFALAVIMMALAFTLDAVALSQGSQQIHDTLKRAIEDGAFSEQIGSKTTGDILCQKRKH